MREFMFGRGKTIDSLKHEKTILHIGVFDGHDGVLGTDQTEAGNSP